MVKVGAVRLRARVFERARAALSPRATGFASFSGDARAESVRVAIAIVVRRGALAAVVSAIAFFFLIACLDRSAPEVSAAEAGASARARPDRDRRRPRAREHAWMTREEPFDRAAAAARKVRSDT